VILPSGASTTDYSRLANSRGWGSGWPACGGMAGKIVKINLTRSGTSIAGGVHRDIAELFLLIGNEIERRGYMFHPGWCWGAECRAISGSNTPSNHSWGLAVDINAPNNPYTSSGQHDIPEWAFALFRSYGFGCGADYSGKKDWMHVEAMGTPSDMAAMTALARRNIGGGGVVITPPPIDPNTDEDAWLTVGAKEDIIREIRYGNDKVMEGKGGEPPDHNIAQVKAAVAELTNIVKGMYNTMVAPQFQGQGAHGYRDETAWATDMVIVPKLDAILAALGTAPPAAPTTHTVVSGDTLSGIAAKYGHTTAELQQWNNIADPNSIQVGQVIKLTP